jgi:Ca-activated chloride channel homolog
MQRLVCIAALAGAVASLATAPQVRPTFRAANRTVVLHATVRASDGRMVNDLPRDVFTVRDNGRPVALTVFSNDPQPLTLVLLVDMSVSMDGSFLQVREATRHFVDALQPEDRVRIGTFGDEVALSPHLTGDKQILRRVLDEELWPGGASPIWNATLTAMTSLRNEIGRRVVLVVTDGVNMPQGFSGSHADALRRATREGVMVYAIGVERMGIHVDLKALVDETGGGWFEIRGGDDVTRAFTRVSDELRRQYVLGFTPAALDGKQHALQVTLADPALTARARRSYMATPDRR